MIKNYDGRIKKIEKAVQEIINPENNSIVSIVIDRRIGETEDKITEIEKKLGRKLKRSNIFIVYVDHYKGKYNKNDAGDSNSQYGVQGIL